MKLNACFQCTKCRSEGAGEGLRQPWREAAPLRHKLPVELSLQMRLMSLEMVLMSLGVGLEQGLGAEFKGDFDGCDECGCVVAVSLGCVS